MRQDFDWSPIRSFLAALACGSLRGVARTPGACAHRNRLRPRGTPLPTPDRLALALFGHDHKVAFVCGFAATGVAICKDNVAVRTDAPVQFLPMHKMPSITAWVAVHRYTPTRRRVRAGQVVMAQTVRDASS